MDVVSEPWKRLVVVWKRGLKESTYGYQEDVGLAPELLCGKALACLRVFGFEEVVEEVSSIGVCAKLHSLL